MWAFSRYYADFPSATVFYFGDLCNPMYLPATACFVEPIPYPTSINQLIDVCWRMYESQFVGMRAVSDVSVDDCVFSLLLL